VVAKRVKDTRLIPREEDGEPKLPGWLIAEQDMHELRREQAVYGAALSLVKWMTATNDNSQAAKQFIEIIAERVKDWPGQWDREKRLRRVEPNWRLREASLKRIEGLRRHLVPDALTCRIVICELLNSFPSTSYPNVSEMHSGIRFGIRPLLYSILRRQFFHPRGFSVCANSECRKFFSIERAGQTFCNAECSIRQRQRDYWQTKGKKMRKKRNSKRKKAT
jgi:hypothetical protein